MMKKKLLGLLAVFAMSAVLLTGCGSSPAAKPGDAAAAPDIKAIDRKSVV